MMNMKLIVSGLPLMFAGLCMAQQGSAVYLQHCQQCHDQNSGAHAPLPEALANIPWQDIVKTLETGVMRAQGAELTAEPVSYTHLRALPAGSRAARDDWDWAG